MTELTVFPVNAHTKVLLQNQDLLSEYHIRYVCSFSEDQPKFPTWEKEFSVTTCTDYIEAIKSSDAILLVDPINQTAIDAYKEIIHLAELNVKPILCTHALRQLLESNEVSTQQITCLDPPAELVQQYNADKLSHIRLPVITVAGMGENCSKFELQLKLLRHLRSEGYHAICVASNPMGHLFGMHTIPQQLFNKLIPFEEQVFFFNHYVHDICEQEAADVMVIGIPGGLSMLGDICTNHFCDIPLIITNAIDTDIGLVNLYFDTEYTPEFIAAYRSYCYFKYNIPVSALLLAKQRVNYDPESNRYNYYYLDNSLIQKIYMDNHYPFAQLDLMPLEQSEPCIISVIDTLAENPTLL